MKHLFPLVLIILFSSILSAQRMVVRIDAPSSALLERFLLEDADIASYQPQSHLDLVVTAEELEALRREFPLIRITQTEAQLKENLRPARDIPGYRNYAQLVSELMTLQAQYPGLMQVSALGTGWGAVYAGQGLPAYQDFDHEVWAVKVSANADLDEDEPAFYFIGEHHAREPLSTEVCMGILIHLVENYGTDPAVTAIMNSSEIWIIPLLNPDGHKIVLDETDVWWRKNIRDNNSNQAFDHQSYGSGYDGVDLNRNYPYKWGYTSATDDMSSATYHGPEGFSEPETQIVRDLLLSKRFLAGIGYHTYGELVLYPYGYVNGIAAPDEAELQTLAFEVASLLPKMSGSGNYSPGPSWGLYPVSGSFDDWAYAETGAYSFTIEMATEFIPPASALPQIVQYQVAGAMALIHRQHFKILRGHVTDALTGDPIVAQVFVDGIDDHPVHRTPIYSESQFGSYYYFLPAGQHTVRFIRPGYETAVRTVTISPVMPTIEEVSLAPSPAQELSIQILDDFFAPVAGAVLSILNITDAQYTSDAQGNIVIPEFYPGEYQLRVSKPGFETLNIMRPVYATSITLRITSLPLLTEDFEESFSNWTATGSWNRTTTDAWEGAYSLTDSPAGNYQNNTNSTCRLTAPLNLQNIDNANLQFMLRTILALDGDNLILECSTDGSNWMVLDFWEGTRDWTLQSYNLNSFIGGDLYLRFRLYTGSWGRMDGVYIDDFKLYTNADASETEETSVPPLAVSLSACPNPFSQSSSITLKTNAGLDNASIGIYNLRGQLVKNLGKQDLGKGTHTFVWNGLDNNGAPAASGIYLVRVFGPPGTLATARIARIR
ncbi:MAG: T9SS type A sorting domain-containing protein [Candidatus Syntrophosphaera sp.]|nr:T9SS type A sorting domain-containing protein [Candidatus Syntrophosphaera sp.]